MQARLCIARSSSLPWVPGRFSWSSGCQRRRGRDERLISCLDGMIQEKGANSCSRPIPTRLRADSDQTPSRHPFSRFSSCPCCACHEICFALAFESAQRVHFAKSRQLEINRRCVEDSLLQDRQLESGKNNFRMSSSRKRAEGSPGIVNSAKTASDVR